MGDIHQINLSTAWQPPSGAAGAWVRRFGRPAGLEAGDRVWLVVTGAGAAGLELNRVPLAVAGAANSCSRHDITPLLGERNELVLMPSGEPAEPGGDRPAGPPPARGHRPLDPRHGTLHLEIIPEDLQSS